MAILNTGIPTNLTEYPNSFKRQGAFPLEAYSTFYSSSDMHTYAEENPIAYVGQMLVLVEGGAVTAYLIKDTAGTLLQLAQTTESGDLAGDVAKLQTKVAKLFEIVGLTSETDQGWTEPDHDDIITSIEALESTVNTLNTTVTGVSGRLTTAEGEIDTLQTDVGELQTTVAGKVGSVAKGDDSITIGGSATAPTVAVAIDSTEGNALTLEEGKGLRVEVPTQTDYTVSITTPDESSVAKRYNIQQAATGLNVNIDIPKDMVIESGQIVDIEGEPYPSGVTEPGTYIELTIANKTGDKLYINVTDLLDEKPVSAKSDNTTITVTVDGSGANYVVGAEVKAGAISETYLADSAVITNKIANNAVTTIKIADGNVTTAKLGADSVTNEKLADDAVQTDNIANGSITNEKLDSTLQTAITNAGTALQKTDVTLESGTNNGTVKLTVDDVVTDNVAVKGLASAAYKAVDTSMDVSAAVTSVNLPTSKAVYDAMVDMLTVEVIV